MVFLWVNKRAWRQPGPVVNIGVRNAHSLAALGRETHFCIGEATALPDSDSATDLRDFYDLPPLDTLHIHRVPRRRTALGTQSSGSIFAYASRLARTLAGQCKTDEAPLVILTREATFLPRLLWLRATLPGTDVRVFYEAHDFYADLSYFAEDRRPVKAQDRRQSWLERLCLPRLDGLICIIGPQHDLYAHRFPRLRTVSLPLGTDPASDELSTEKLEARRAQRRLVYVGQIHQHKGVRLAMRAAPELRAAGVRLAFWGGSEKQCGELREQAREIGCGDTVEAVSFRPPGALHHALADDASLGFVALEPNYYNRLLTCPVKALDYLSHGLPTLATDLPSTRDIFGSTEAARWLPAADDAAAFARTALTLLDDSTAYARAARAARARAEELSWENRARRLVKFVTADIPRG